MGFVEQTQDLERLPVAAELEHVERVDGSRLPRRVVETQEKLAKLDDETLRHLIIGAAVQLAARDRDPRVTPAVVLEKAVEAAPKRRWEDHTQPEVRRIIHRVRGS